jgi:hypothetical protein
MSLTITLKAADGATSNLTIAGPNVVSSNTTLVPISIGQTSILSGADGQNGNLLVSQEITLPANNAYQLQSLSFHVQAAAGNLVLGIYNNANGKPGTLLSQTPSFATVSGWNTVTPSPLPTLNAGNYWLAYFPQSSNLTFNNAAVGNAYFTPLTFGAMPNTFPTGTAISTNWSLYATFLETAAANNANTGNTGTGNTGLAGVTLQPIDGGPNFYSNNRFTYAANAGWDTPAFFPIGVWEDSILQQSDATRWLDLGWNTAFQITSDSLLPLLNSNKIWAIQTVQSGAAVISGTSNETVGLLSYDEPSSFADGVSTPLGTTPSNVQNGRFWWLNDTWNTIQYGGLPNTPAPGTASTDLTYLVTTPDGSKRHIDTFSIDQYWFSGSQVGGVLSSGGLLDNLGQDMTSDQAARGSNYGDIISDERVITGGINPIYGFVENGGPYLENTSASTYITPPQLNWAVWSTLIHGARAICYFNHTFGGPAQSDDNMAQAYYQTVQAGQTVSVYAQTKATNALVKQMAPVLNAPYAINYASVNPAGYHYDVVDNLFSGIEIMAKFYQSQYYIFAVTRMSQTATNISATFTLADKAATSAVVVNEGRSIPITNGVFTDIFATAATVHIYQIVG